MAMVDLNAPNLVTLSRIALIPLLVVIWFVDHPWAGWLAAGVSAFGSVTDWLDGWLARRMNRQSAFGAFLDPVADKLFVAAALVLVVERSASVVVTVCAVTILVREISVSALREWMARQNLAHAVRVGWVGKAKTTI